MEAEDAERKGFDRRPGVTGRFRSRARHNTDRSASAHASLAGGAFGGRQLITSGGVKPLGVAYRQNHMEVVRLLLEKGADVDLKDHQGKTAIMGAAFDNKVEVVKLLLERGVDGNSPGALVASRIAGDLGHTELVEMFEAQGSIGWEPNQTLIRAAADGDVFRVKNLLEQGACPNAHDTEGIGATPLTAASFNVFVVSENGNRNWGFLVESW